MKNIDKKWQIRIEEKENIYRNKAENRKKKNYSNIFGRTKIIDNKLRTKFASKM